jgi:hypothetical protein
MQSESAFRPKRVFRPAALTLPESDQVDEACECNDCAADGGEDAVQRDAPGQWPHNQSPSTQSAAQKTFLRSVIGG